MISDSATKSIWSGDIITKCVKYRANIQKQRMLYREMDVYVDLGITDFCGASIYCEHWLAHISLSADDERKNYTTTWHSNEWTDTIAH